MGVVGAMDFEDLAELGEIEEENNSEDEETGK